jgi:hypothetical protein
MLSAPEGRRDPEEPAEPTAMSGSGITEPFVNEKTALTSLAAPWAQW